MKLVAYMPVVDLREGLGGYSPSSLTPQGMHKNDWTDI